jgi:fructokinase
MSQSSTNKRRPVICFGEALIDFLQTSQQTEDLLELNNYRQYPGGAPANAAVAVAKLGGNALFAGQVGDDPFGEFLIDALNKYHVNTKFVTKHPTAKTALAFVILDKTGERSFSFHRHQTADLLFKNTQVDQEWFNHSPIFHFCSNTLTDNDIASCTKYAVQRALANNVLISFDVNLRHNLWPSGEVNIGIVNRLVKQAHILKFSLDELTYLAQGDIETYIEDCFQAQCQLIVITDGEKILTYYTAENLDAIYPPTVNAIDTTAGGDAFIGAFLFSLSHFEHITKLFNDSELLKQVITFSACCGALAVTKNGAFPALPNFEQGITFLKEQGSTQSQLLDIFSRST